MSLCGDRGKPWKQVKKTHLGRFAKSDNWLEPASYLDQLSQKEGQSATSYCEAFAAAVDKTILGAQTSVGMRSWRTGHTHYLYKLLEHANPGQAHPHRKPPPHRQARFMSVIRATVFLPIWHPS